MSPYLKTSLLLLALAAAGCSSAPERPVHDPEFTPVYPVTKQQPVAINGAIFSDEGNGIFQNNTKAHQIGDLLTIRLQESLNASKSTNTATAKSGSVDMKASTLLDGALLNNQLEGSSGFSGTGSSTQTNSLSGNITVTVVNVLANGNLMVRGEKVMRLNQGDEFVRLSGVVRPSDIDTNNSVASYKIANAEIIVGGNGVVANAGKAGWLSRFFNSPMWPF
ncbi:hypothetical protein D5085_12570 [Ectothiorhodospiraceae bacterium BW-2]|nr:hypothetical protein D5085_12570 [Ectothiorhodospiraceae bacterium BW-2]